MRSPLLSPLSFACAPVLCAAASLSLILASAPLAPAALPTPPPKQEYLDNGGFERASSSLDNLWDGVNSTGQLAGFTFSARVLTETSAFSGLAMPPSVAFVDLNGDGRPGLVTADPTGYFRFYPNSGTPTAPKFTNAEIIPIFLSTTPVQRKDERATNNDGDDIRTCPRFALADWRGRGVLDMVIGNYLGELFFIPNTGTAKQPIFRQPQTIDSARIPTNDQGRLWANLLSPVAANWTGKGRLDLLLGEGTYSANAIHLLENIGNGDMPKFAPGAKKSYVAYGYGREQLIPAVVDYNNDGNLDLLIADRTGEVGVYLNPGKYTPGVELKRVSTISFGGTSTLPGLCSIYPADYNGDGLFDLIIGLPNGRIAVALNTGTLGNPSFGPIKEIHGTDRLGRNILLPDGWTTDTWGVYGNALAYFNVVNAKDDPDSKPPEGSNCLKAGYWPAVGQTFPMPADGIPGALKHFTLIRRGLTLDTNKRYHFSFKAKGSGMEKMRWAFGSHFAGYPGAVKVERGERGEAKSGAVDEYVDLGSDFTVGSDWGNVEGDITPRYKAQTLQDRKQMPMTLYVDFWATSLSSVAYFDDMHLVEP